MKDQHGHLTPESVEAYEKILVMNLQRAIDFLKFAEAKNAALLALSSAWFVAAINLQCSSKPIPNVLAVSVTFSSFFSLCAALLTLLSFLPRLHLPGFLGGKRAGPHPKNLLFFGDISMLTLKTLEAELHARYFPKTNVHTDEYIHDLVVQIGVNSQIIMRKMRLFLAGVWLVVAAALVFLLPVGGMAFKVIRVLW